MAALNVSRRGVLAGSAVTVAGAIVGFVLARNSDAAKAVGGAAAANQYGPKAGGGGTRLAALDAVPDGGGLVVDSADVVLVRSGDEVLGFSATCTHQGCTVTGVEDGAISCPCHGSRFDPKTGEPVAGPAGRPLAKVPVEVRDGAVFTA
jgi:Rieske Fe-S protein